VPRPDRSEAIETALLGAVDAHAHDLVPHVAREMALSRAAVAARARALVEAGYLAKDGTTRPVYRRGVNRRGIYEYTRTGLAEDQVWLRDARPLLESLPRNVLDIAHHGLTEMVNNAIDHSEGARVQVAIDLDGERLAMMVADDGVGIFRKITRALSLPDERLALLELSKGKLTTDPRRHSGEGVFFTSRMFDRFQIASGELVFDHDHADSADLLYHLDPDDVRTGTTVLMEIGVDATRTDTEVFEAFSSGPDEYAFAKTVVPVRLARIGDENLVSRSQAKRLLQRVDRFRHVVFDFESVERIGQAFADEIFRVFALANPHVELVAQHATPGIQQMIRRAEVLRDETAALEPPTP
jgi:anti-sigma regulatory factor (Ser/Thr protein kinase)